MMICDGVGDECSDPADWLCGGAFGRAVVYWVFTG
jgi:hypothetical protein